MEKIVILNNIRSNENVGSIFRTCDAVGVSKIYLVGITPAPLDRFNRVNTGLTKASLGAEKSVEWEKIESLGEVIRKLNPTSLKLRGTKEFKIVGIEQDKKSIDYRDIKQSVASREHLALVFGNEVEGLSKEDLKLCDEIIEIPMQDAMVRQAHHPRYSMRGKESFNFVVDTIEY